MSLRPPVLRTSLAAMALFLMTLPAPGEAWPGELQQRRNRRPRGWFSGEDGSGPQDWHSWRDDRADVVESAAFASARVELVLRGVESQWRRPQRIREPEEEPGTAALACERYTMRGEWNSAGLAGADRKMHSPDTVLPSTPRLEWKFFAPREAKSRDQSAGTAYLHLRVSIPSGDI